jgi:magnesium chelatase subunit I
MGVNTIEREGVSFSHQARSTLVGTMNPEEGELRPQLLDRFGLCVQIEGLREPEQRVEVVKRRAAYEEDTERFRARWNAESEKIAAEIASAIKLYPEVSADDRILYAIAAKSLEAGVDGHRSDIIMLKAGKAIAAMRGRREVIESDIEEAAEFSRPHRMRLRPFEEIIKSGQ